MAYFDYARGQGFRNVSIWSCPPAQTDDYMFYAHPKDMKFPNSKRLKQWYERLLDKGVAKGCVRFYTDISRRAAMDRMKQIIQLPYLDGDLWPGKIEEAIQFVLDDTAKKMQAEVAKAASASQCTASQNQSPNSSQNLSQNDEEAGASGSKKKRGRPAKPKESKSIHEILNENILHQMRTKVDVFFDVSLCDPQEAEVSVIIDPDPDLNCPMLDGREAFLRYCRAEFNEFSDLRNATYSTLRMLEIVTSCQVDESLRHWLSFHHYCTCRIPGCDNASCLKWKEIMSAADGKVVKSGPHRTNMTMQQGLKDGATGCFIHHVRLCPGCKYDPCVQLKMRQPNLHSHPYNT